MRLFNSMSMACAAAGSAFVIAGLLEALSAWYAVEWLDLMTAGNLKLGLVLVLAGAVLLAGAREAVHDREGYLVVGSLLGLFAGAVALLTMGANCAEHLLGNEDLAGWTAIDDLTLAIAMMVPSALLLRHGLRAHRSAPSPEAAA